ncbi:hypothetical protein GH714_017397 [Hevea brasiliensis]|uniref:Uncharacterized protein n=1 Tax=Hevea brasiliensis TaxID=3981 RepID=A0A6A6LTA8_HEVBR|nr:hypothetical protein GH714_017397 [Hevea brasiliensis]
MSKPAGEDAAESTNNEANGTVVVANGNGAAAGVIAETGMAATAAALEAAADAGKLKFGGAQGAQAGFMARKQRIEATVGCRVPENDGRRHALTLTVSDYKRRRGLL